MKLLFSSIPQPRVWEYHNGVISPVDFETFDDDYLCTCDDIDYDLKFPLEIQLEIFKHLLDLYIRTRNFELVLDLIQVSKPVCDLIYKTVFKKSSRSLIEKAKRLIQTFNICQRIHDYYITSKRLFPFSAISLVRESINLKDPLQIWDFHFGYSIKQQPGIITDEESEAEQVIVGPNHGDTLWIRGEWEDSFFNCEELNIPIINIILSDYFKVLIPTESSIKNCSSIIRFSALLRKAYGPRVSINFMVRNDYDVDNVFVTSSDLFYSF